MSEINKLDNTACPFNPEQYKKKVDVEIDGVPPIGSLPWALIQVYLGKVVSRSSWDASNEYIQLTTKSDGSAPVHIEKHDQQSFPYDWEPTPEDLMACDWKLLASVRPESTMLSFDLKIGTSKYRIDQSQNQSQDWGYLSQKDNTNGESNFGILTNLQSNIGIENISKFILYEPNAGSFGSIILSFESNHPNILGLLNKNLQITVDGSTYNLRALPDEVDGSDGSYDIFYTVDDAQKLGSLLQNQVGNTLHFGFNWQ
ncbi:DUF2829 domain-containing protein [Xenorhabdus sp. DI]|uniref:Thoeris anti-defense Tad2 family protein n=1 Tax=Xenorhabdus doucetiae TaxID=351671 RepID=UPI00198616EF|nr:MULTISPECIES: MW1434 family type I TA system toxin [unclassified Xenorhabdus]MBD2785295.1 DUF2829 domain-containing protein [Xenorhabdus sp. 3]MBD2788238.1 DUF2829 domain-containing protein [Xenorhabdus sp. DI]